jgi:hypothetical protein
VHGSVVHDRFDVLIRGRALSPASLEEVSLRAGDRTMALASFGEPERASDGSMPDGAASRQRGFQFNLPLQNGGKPELSNFQIVARTVDGLDYAEEFSIELDPTALRPISVVTGPTRSSGLGRVRPHTMLHIERGAMDNAGVLTVEGWALSLGRISAVQLFIGRQRISAARLGGDREDVAAAYGDYPDARLSGFSLTLRVEEEDRYAANIRARLIGPDGFAHEETIPIERIDQRPGSWSVIPTAEEPATVSAAAAAASTSGLEASSIVRMFCDEAKLRDDGHLFVSGWAVCAAGIAQVRVLLDEKNLGLAVFGYERADVGAAHATIPMARWSGFKFERRLDRRFEGEHIVRVVVRDPRAGKQEESLLVVATAVAEDDPPEGLVVPGSDLETTAAEAAEFRFTLESPAVADDAAIDPFTDRLRIEGWLLCRSSIASFDVFLDDRRLGEAHGGLAREDVGAAFPEWPNAQRSGFAFDFPSASLRDGDHTVALMVRASSGRKMIRQFQIKVEGSHGVRG